ncbi:MAG: glucokinase, partial [Proteobacteria bacterium]|nr:glucokinase [Pseudomonadota bacterium]
EAAQAYLQQSALAPGVVKRAAFAVATAVNDDTVKLTNSAWSFQRSELERLLGLDQLEIFNDFEALARGLPGLAATDFRLIGTVPPSLTQSMVVIGPGTGLGVAGMIPSRHGWVTVPGEGGHATLSASDDFEAEILKAARRDYSHVSAERLLSGIGLPVLLRAVCAVQGTVAVDLPAQRISAQALSDPQCRTTMEVFFAFLGGFAGNLALSFGARGGVFIGGGIVPQLQDLLACSRFRERFESKGRFQAYLAGIGTATITAPHVALRGLACALENADPD